MGRGAGPVRRAGASPSALLPAAADSDGPGAVPCVRRSAYCLFGAIGLDYRHLQTHRVAEREGRHASDLAETAARRGPARVSRRRGAADSRGVFVSPSTGVAVGSVWGVFVGVSEYQQKELNLTYADQDAKALHAFFVQQFTGRIPADQFRVLSNGQATRGRILKEVGEVLRLAQPEDLVILFLALHGLPDTTGQDLSSPMTRMRICRRTGGSAGTTCSSRSSGARCVRSCSCSMPATPGASGRPRPCSPCGAPMRRMSTGCWWRWGRRRTGLRCSPPPARRSGRWRGRSSAGATRRSPVRC